MSSFPYFLSKVSDSCDAFLLFITDTSVDFSSEEVIEQYKKWMRICRNIIYNTYIQNPDNFIDAIKAIKDLSVHKHVIEEAIIKENFSISFFDSQLKEEIKKIRYFAKGGNWKRMILQTENHPYFYGQMDFIFKLVNDSDDYGSFEDYCKKLSKIFDKPEANDYHFQRLLLSKGDYLIRMNSKYSFCDSGTGSLRLRQDNWRKVFNDKVSLSYLKAALDEPHLFDISENALLTISDLQWRYFFIHKKYVDNINYLQNWLIDWQSEWDIRLLEKSTLVGKHADLYSHSLYLDLKSRDFQVTYTSVNGRRSESNRPKIEIMFDNKSIDLYYEPNYDAEECAFVIESALSQFADTSEFTIVANDLVYKMNKSTVAEQYAEALNSIEKLLKSVNL